MSRPSKNLSWKELACKDGTPYPQEWRRSRAIILSEIFELIRAACEDKPISVLSAYRSYLHNKKVGGARNSQHMQGRALDLRPPSGYSVDQLYEIIKLISPLTAIRGIGKYKTFVHVDIRPTEKIAYWFGTGVKDS